MLSHHLAALSVWEIAHRWHGYDPNTTDPHALPLEVQDRLRLLTRLMYEHDLNSCNEKGVENWVLGDMLGREALLKTNEHKTLSDEELEEQYRAYAEQYEWRASFHTNLVKDFDQCFRYRVYDKATLDRVFIFQPTLFEVCREHGIKPPTFWQCEDGTGENIAIRTEQAEEPAQAIKAESNLRPDPETKIRRGVLAKELVQAVARTLWDEHPGMTTADMIRHKAIQKYASAAQYTEKYIRNWIKEVDPRPPTEKRGRPKKKLEPSPKTE